MNEIDGAIEELRERLADLRAEVASREHQITEILAEIRGMERARDLFAPAEPEKSGRHDVQGPVMARFKDGGTWSEDALVHDVDLPRLSVRKFLSRAVRDGKLVCSDGVYALPSATARAAE